MVNMILMERTGCHETFDCGRRKADQGGDTPEPGSGGALHRQRDPGGRRCQRSGGGASGGTGHRAHGRAHAADERRGDGGKAFRAASGHIPGLYERLLRQRVSEGGHQAEGRQLCGKASGHPGAGGGA